MRKKVYKKPYSMKLHLNKYLLTLMYFCYCFKIPMDLMVALYEVYERHSLFVFKALACKGYIRLDDDIFSESITFFTSIEKQLKNRSLNLDNISGKRREFLDYLISNTSDIYSYTVNFFFDLEDFYGRKKS